jgi:glycosyltransferase involved in cell wall biosynthesis
MDFHRIKVLYIISSLSKQGPVQVLYNILVNLDFLKFEVTLITLKKEQENSILMQFSALPITIISFEGINKFNFIKLNHQLRIFLKMNNINVVHSNCTRSLILNYFATCFVKKIHTIHIYPGLQSKAMHGPLMGNLINILTKQLIKRIEYPIACSESLKESLYQKDNIQVRCIQNGVLSVGEQNIPRDELKRELNLDPNIKYFISIGRFSKEKNFSFLVNSFKNLRLKGYKLIILGDGILYNEISIASDDSIILPGFKSNVYDYLLASDYYISASLTEGMPLSVLEAMSLGLPIILSEILPHKEILTKAGNKIIGVIFNYTVKNDLKDKIESLIIMNYSQLKKNTISVFNMNFRADKMSLEYQKLYINAVNNGIVDKKNY